MTNEEKIQSALKGELPVEQWMIEDRRVAAKDAEAYGNGFGCDRHIALSRENLREMVKLEKLMKSQDYEK